MKKLAIICLWAAAASVFQASARSEAARPGDLPLMAMVPTGPDGFPAAAASAMKAKLLQVATAAGLGSLDDYARFGLMVTAQPESKEVVAGAPPMIAQTLVFTFYIGDRFDETLFATASVRAKGVGSNETKAYMQAIKRIDPRQLEDFAAEGRRKIIEYFNANCDRIVAKARSLAARHEYEQAIFYLTQVPEVCAECYTAAIKASEEIFQQYVDYLCEVNLAKARVAWAAHQNSDGASEAGEYLQYIYPEAKCYGEAMELYKEIRKKVLDDWKFVMKVYQDGVDLQKQRIAAMRDVGMEWGRNQRPITYAPNWIR